MTPEERIKINFIIFTILKTIEFDNPDDEETLVNCLQTIQSLTEDCDDTFIRQLCQATTCIDLLIKSLQTDRKNLISRALKISGSIASSSYDECLDMFIFQEGLKALGY